MSEYTASIEAIRYAWMNYRGNHGPHMAEFDRWLASVKAEAWDEGYTRSVSDLSGFESDGSTTMNPYREESK